MSSLGGGDDLVAPPEAPLEARVSSGRLNERDADDCRRAGGHDWKRIVDRFVVVGKHHRSVEALHPVGAALDPALGDWDDAG